MHEPFFLPFRSKLRLNKGCENRLRWRRTSTRESVIIQLGLSFFTYECSFFLNLYESFECRYHVTPALRAFREYKHFFWHPYKFLSGTQLNHFRRQGCFAVSQTLTDQCVRDGIHL